MRDTDAVAISRSLREVGGVGFPPRSCSIALFRDHSRGELLFDPATSDVLQWDQVQVAPGPVRRIPVGAVLHYFAYEGRGVVDSIEALPGGGRVTLHAGRP